MNRLLFSLTNKVTEQSFPNANMQFSLELIEKIVDQLWDNIVVKMDTSFYFSLLLVSKDFHTVLLQRRRELMRAQAAALHREHNLLRFKNPLGNPLVNPRILLSRMVSSLLHAPDARLESTDIALFVFEHRSLFDNMMEILEHPVMFGGEYGATFASFKVIKLDDSGQRRAIPQLFKGVSEFRFRGGYDVWDYAILCDSQSIGTERAQKLYMFKMINPNSNSPTIVYANPKWEDSAATRRLRSRSPR
ncbi:hypothetical protein DFJ77DRAFT_545284 [Powellomyces hirtus]|nr:hypothetical protein DFJ77DRAFT_545284 [Powellomyces hirtus]